MSNDPPQKARFRPPTPVPSKRRYAQVDQHYRGTGQGSTDYGSNTVELTKRHQKRIWKVIDELRDEGVYTSHIVMALLDNAVDLSATQNENEGSVYALFVEATADIFNHYATQGLSDCSSEW